MDKYLKHTTLKNLNSKIQITGSKSESNRLLILQALFDGISVENISNSDDSVVMQKALSSNEKVIDVHHAGTAMRFLTAYYACLEGREVTLTGSGRMQERPIGVLVDTLRQLGANIEYVKEEGFPPLLIKGKTLELSKINIKANVSSQYISALLLIAPKLKNGLQLTLDGEITSVPYINMTLSLLYNIGVDATFKGNVIQVQPRAKVKKCQLVVESDWSSVSYHFSIVAMSPIGSKITLGSYFKESLQGDAILVKIYEQFGVFTTFVGNIIIIEKRSLHQKTNIELDLKKSPDIAQTIAVTCFGLGIACRLTGLHTLKIKETDRLLALQNELEKLGASIEVTNNSLHLQTSKNIKSSVSIVTYQDHRMAMAFAPLAVKTDIYVQEAEVVSKSYPTFWEDLQQLGFK